jgi:hypothetical protein
MKKTIVLYSRCDLVYLYGALNRYLSDEFNIVHVAYSHIEEQILRNKYNIKNVINFKKKVFEIKDISIQPDILNKLDEMFFLNTNGRFNLNGSMVSDRTFKMLNYDQALQITQIYYLVWNEIFKSQKIHFFIHEPTSLMMNHIAFVLCKEYDCIYSTHIQSKGENQYDFLMLDNDDGHPTELLYRYNEINSINVEEEKVRIQAYLVKFRSEYEVFFGEIGSKNRASIFDLKLILQCIKEIIISKRAKKLDPVKDNIDYFLAKDKPSLRKLKNLFRYRQFKYDEFSAEDNFYFYPLHLEPEAIVLYWADGIYSNQVKLIENIASQLPYGSILYVKDHPHLYGYRDVKDYITIQNIPNVKIISPEIPGKSIIRFSLGVITLNGTAGFEALLLNKHVITFGNPFYKISSRVKYVKNIKDLASILYSIQDIKYQDDYELYRFVLAYLKSLKEGFPELYFGLMDKLPINKEEDILKISEGLSLFFNEYDLL